MRNGRILAEEEPLKVIEKFHMTVSDYSVIVVCYCIVTPWLLYTLYFTFHIMYLNDWPFSWNM